MLKLKSLSFLFAPLALASVISVGDVAINSFLLDSQNLAVAQEMTAQQKIDIINKSKGQVGSGDQLRRFFYGDLLPLAVQPGGAGMVVNLYNKANDITFSYCATYDVVVAIKKGRVAMFPANEVK
ncbi:hypothetical protein ACE1CI_03720 [Aerosakkonemataceae cyanobacterium BLCC-F50]|uniref:Uncharacterized protein n=1 Tax=Floridaenema flaviceps BLCC-F50 TaxID=3153642 RepID=A0ABV4XLQ9_9CYAN